MSANTELEQPRDLNEAWENARKAFQDRTKIELYPESQQTLEGVLSSLDARYNPDPSKVAAVQKKQRIKDNVVKICSVVNILGSVSAQGASVVFGPAGTCFNAIALLLDAPGKIFKVYEGLADLFEEIAHFMVRFDILKQIDGEGLLDKVLISNSNDLLIKLVDICGLMISLIRKSTWTKIKTGLKATFIDDDSGVQEALESFRRLADRQSAIIQDFNLYHAARTDASMGRLEPKVELVWEDISSRRNKESSKERLRSLAMKLNVPLENLHDLTTTPQTKLHDTARRLFPGSQEWLNSLIPYVEWKDSQPGLHRLLHVSAEARCGKSCFLASVFSDALGSDSDLFVGHYSYGQTPVYSSQRNETTGTEPLMALKAIALQIAQLSSEYAARLEDSLTDSPPRDDENLNVTWERLFSATGNQRSTTKVLMLFDNVDKLPIEVCEEFMSVLYEKCDGMMENKSLAIWALTTANPRMLRQMSAKSFIQLDVHEHSSPLLEKHILRALEAHPTLRQSHPGILRLKSEVRSRLPRLAQGDFGFVNKRIDQLVKCVNSGEDSLDTLLGMIKQDASADQGKAVHRLFKSLEQNLNSREIEHLNILLQWTMYGGRKLTLDQLEQALLLHSDQDHLLPLEGRVRHRYSDVFNVEAGRVSLKDDVASYLRSISTNTQVSGTSPAKISMTIKVEDASSAEVKQFLWQLSDAVSTGTLRLDWTTPRQDTSHPSISISATESYANLTSQCLQLLTDDEGEEKYSALATYALLQLPYLLGQLSKIAEGGQLASSTKQVIVQRLINLLRDTESWERHFRVQNDQFLWLAWILPPKVLDDIQYWITETEALRLIEPIHRRWCKAMMSLNKAPGSFWEPFTTEVARMWLCEREVITAKCWQWIDSFLEMQNGTQTGHKVGGPDFWHPRIRAAANWGSQALGLQSLDSLYFERLGYAFLDGIHGGMTAESKKRWSQAAIAQFSKATAHDCHWKVDHGIAMAYNHMMDVEMATESISKGIEKLRVSMQAKPDDQEEREAMLSELKTLAAWRASASDHKYASALYDQVLEISPNDYGCHWRRFRSLCQAKEEQRARTALMDLAHKEGKHKGATQLAESLHRLITGALDTAVVEDDVTSSLLNVVKDRELRSEVLGAIHDNLVYAMHSKRPFDEAKMLLLQGIILAQSAGSEAELVKAQKSWQKCILLCEGHFNLAKWVSIYCSALRYEGNYHFGCLIDASSKTESSEMKSHLYYLRRIAKAAARVHGRPCYGPTTYLAAYHWLKGRQSMARKELQLDLQRGIEILSDDDPDNDHLGYHVLAVAFNHAGDEINALSAWSMLGPPKKSTPSSSTSKADPAKSQKHIASPISHYCDGLCGKKWKHADDDMWVCKYCPNTDFCTACKEKLQQGRLERYYCSPTHDWLHVPSASMLEHDTVPEGHIRVGGQMQGDQRVGGEVIEVKAWLDKIQQEWNNSIAELTESPDIEDD